MAQHPHPISRVQLPWRQDRYTAVVFAGLFSPQECADLVARSEQHGYDAALVNIGRGRQQKMDDVRNNDRCILDDPAVAAMIWQRVQEAAAAASTTSNNSERGHDDGGGVPLPGELVGLDKALHSFPTCKGRQKKTWYPVGLNERLRFLRYQPHTYFKPHLDGSYRRHGEAGEARRGETSFCTLQLYLNEDFEGGATNFLSQGLWGEDDSTTIKIPVTPRTGSVLVFQHDLLHEGAPVTSGTKYVIRTDIMYTDKGPGHEYVNDPILPGDEKGKNEDMDCRKGVPCKKKIDSDRSKGVGRSSDVNGAVERTHRKCRGKELWQ